MKITAIRATPVNIPLEVPYFWSTGTYPGTSKTVIEVETDVGLVGLGESPSSDCAPAITHGLAPRLIGFDPLDTAACWSACVPEARVVQNTDDSSVLKSFGGIEMALWDLRGKFWRLPLYQLLGGAVRKQIPFTEYFAFRERRGKLGGELTPKAVASYCARMRERHGSTFFEGKLTLGDPDLEIAAVKAIRRAVGDDAMLRLDANMAWSLSTARRILREIEPCNVRNYEDPVATFDEMAKLRQHSRIPFSTHTPDLRTAVRLGVPDTFVLNFAVLGGISRTREFIAACEAMGVGFWCYSGETGIGSAAYLHVVAATPWIHEPSQSLFRWQIDDVIEEGPFRPRRNVLPVPEGHGLGVTLSAPALRRCHERFLREGPYNHYHDPKAPGKFRRLPLD
ncbi:MAG: mandelate racemase/muconate lactonizing enzyme family protein [Opitutaceae bacterium]|nr:mandelate racemase/muconate lactonizing enzyme family protein [Opitutaceae bacterium]